MKKQEANPQIEEQLQANWPVFFDSIKVMKHKERSEHEGHMAMNVTCDPGLDPGPEKKDFRGTTGKT